MKDTNNTSPHLFLVNTRIKAGADQATTQLDDFTQQVQDAFEASQKAINDFIKQQQDAVSGASG